MCSLCGAKLLEPPIRDNGLEMVLADAIELGLVPKSAAQSSTKVAGRDNEYIWSDIKSGEE